MCGVVAIYHHAGGQRVDRGELARMRGQMAARGPDGHDQWCSNDGAVGLGHQRLAIIGLGQEGHQPMRRQDGDLCITFNGAIYNHQALRQELIEDGHRFSGQADCEVLLQLYRRDGIAMLHKLRGMYAFVLWDGQRRRMLMARDPYGIKPLYYAADSRTVRAASQVRALSLSEDVDTSLDAAGLVGFLSFGNVPEPWTLQRGIRALPAGHYAVIDEQGMQPPAAYASVSDVLRYAEERPAPRMPIPALQQQLRDALLDSVKHHLVADVPVAIFLSSGLDSGTLLALASEVADAPLSSMTLAFEDAAGGPQDEASLAALVARRHRSEHHVQRVSRDSLFTAASGWWEAMDQPTIDGLNVWMISDAARQRGIKVALSGLGGDELFGGYPSFEQIPRLVKATRWSRFFPNLGRDVQKLHERVLTPLQLTNAKAAGLLRYGSGVAGAYLLRRGLFLPSELFELLDDDIAHAGLRAFSPVDVAEQVAPPDSPPSFEKICALESVLYLRNQLLRDGDWASMAHGVELRAPLVDYALLERLSRSLGQLWTRGGKNVLVKTPVRALPQAITVRAKRGFEVPVAPWLEHPDLGFDEWRRVPALCRTDVPWSRRLAYTLARRFAGPESMA